MSQMPTIPVYEWRSISGPIYFHPKLKILYIVPDERGAFSQRFRGKQPEFQTLTGVKRGALSMWGDSESEQNLRILPGMILKSFRR